MSGRKYQYLKMMSPDAAWTTWLAALPSFAPALEDIDVEQALGRIAAAPVYAPRSSPGYHGAAMDGYALISRDTAGASEARPLRLKLGEVAFAVDTGDPLPDGCDAVVMVEHTHESGGDSIEILKSVSPWQHVRLMGEDLVQTELVLPRGKRISPYDVGALLAVGVTRIHVRRAPRVAIVPTGDELVEPGQPAPRGAVVEFNSRMLAAMIVEWGGAPTRLPPIHDDPQALERALWDALENADIVVVNAGSSAGRGDHTPSVVARMGQLCVHGVRVMPGKPTALGVVGGKPVLGLPGYPVSAVVAAELFLWPLLCRYFGIVQPKRPRVLARLGRKIASKEGLLEVVRVQVGRVGGHTIATPLGRGAGVISSLARASGLVRIPALAEGLEANSQVEVELLVSQEALDRTLLHVGSHDLSLDILDDLLRAQQPGWALASANVGSLGGLLALGRGEGHFAGVHLLDPSSGEYNVPYIARYLAGRKTVLVHVVRREQGFYVVRGNPKGIAGVADLARPDVQFVNRQRGAGTRVLLDARLDSAGISSDGVRGYERCEYTHLAVAAAVASGTADVGMGIRAAATALKLDFLPLEWEPYELCVFADSLGELNPLLMILGSPAFRRATEALGGYDASRSGEIRYVGEARHHAL